jgi:hypothetical protein
MRLFYKEVRKEGRKEGRKDASSIAERFLLPFSFLPSFNFNFIEEMSEIKCSNR